MGFFTRSDSSGGVKTTGSSSKLKFFSLPAISTSESEACSDEYSVSRHAHRHRKIKARNSSRTTEPTTSASSSEDLSYASDAPAVAPSSSSHIPPLQYLNSNKKSRKNKKHHSTVSGDTSVCSQTKIGTAMGRIRSGVSAATNGSKKSLKKSSSKKSLSSKKSDVTQRSSNSRTAAVSMTTTSVKKNNSDINNVKSVPTDEAAAAALEEAARVKLGKDMMVLADGIHLDNNTKNLLASFDAKTIEDFFMMGDADFQLLLAKARSSNRGLPPLQIRKVRILREWTTQLVESTHPELTGPLCFSPRSTNHRGNTRDDGLLPHDWKRRFRKDLPALKKKLRKNGDSWAEVFPFLSHLIGFRDTWCGGPRY